MLLRISLCFSYQLLSLSSITHILHEIEEEEEEEEEEEASRPFKFQTLFRREGYISLFVNSLLTLNLY